MTFLTTYPTYIFQLVVFKCFQIIFHIKTILRFSLDSCIMKMIKIGFEAICSGFSGQKSIKNRCLKGSKIEKRSSGVCRDGEILINRMWRNQVGKKSKYWLNNQWRNEKLIKNWKQNLIKMLQHFPMRSTLTTPRLVFKRSDFALRSISTLSDRTTSSSTTFVTWLLNKCI